MSFEQTQNRDRLGRRNRLRPVSTGKRIRIQKRDLLWFQKLQEHGPLSSSFLLEYASETHKSEKRSKERLTDLFNEDNTVHGASYLCRPPQQFQTLDSRYNQLVYYLTPASEDVLKRHGFCLESERNRSGPWLHQHFVSSITSSIELACRSHADIGLTYIPQSYLLRRAETELRYPLLLPPPGGGPAARRDLIPDAFFALEYNQYGDRRFRSFLVEADRSTEPATSENFNRKSWVRSLQQYEIYIGNGYYKAHLGLRTSLLLLIIVTDENRVQQIKNLIPQYAPTISSQILLQVWDDFGPVYKPPFPNPRLLEGPWSRSGLPDFVISKV